MSSGDRKKAALYKKLDQLRSAANSTSVNSASIVMDASRYIQGLKERVETLNQDVESLQDSNKQEDSLPQQVKVETLEKGFLINVVVVCEKNSPGLLLSVLETFEQELGLQVLDARVSCSHNFHLQAVTQKEKETDSDSIDGQMIKGAVLEAIRNWNNSDHQ